MYNIKYHKNAREHRPTRLLYNQTKTNNSSDFFEPNMTKQTTFAPNKLTRQTLNDQVYEQLKEAVISGQLMPGKVLTIRELADSFGVSMMPVREALSRLIAEQVLVLQPNRSVAVPVIDADRFAEITRIRLLLERAATVDGAKAISPSQVERMRELNARMEKTGIGDRRTYLDLNRQFHFTVYRASGQNYTVALIEALWMRVGPLLNFLLEEADIADQHRDLHHEAVLDALRDNDPEAAGDAVVSDISYAATVILRIIERQTSGQD
jgi:DNA-binding GntR family transcriptional regulator